MIKKGLPPFPIVAETAPEVLRITDRTLVVGSSWLGVHDCLAVRFQLQFFSVRSLNGDLAIDLILDRLVELAALALINL